MAIVVETFSRGYAPLKRSNRLSLAIPASFVSDVPHIREKTFRIGLVGRAAVIFRADEVIVFPDFPKTDQRRDTSLIVTILTYMETPQYLRKRLFKIRPELVYAGVLPPLRSLHHPLADRRKDLRVGEFREGVVVSHCRAGSLVDVGVEHQALLRGTRLPTNSRVTVKIAGLDTQLEAVRAKPQEIKTYWGYRVMVSELPFGQMLEKNLFDLVVATSRKGKPIHVVRDELVRSWKTSKRVLVAFGAPNQGLYEIMAHADLRLEDSADFIVNTIPSQGTETVRTEEALYASLAILNVLGE